MESIAFPLNHSSYLPGSGSVCPESWKCLWILQGLKWLSSYLQNIPAQRVQTIWPSSWASPRSSCMRGSNPSALRHPQGSLGKAYRILCWRHLLTGQQTLSGKNSVLVSWEKPLQKSAETSKATSMWSLIRTWLVFRTINSIYDGLPVIKYLRCKRKLGLLTSPDRARGKSDHFFYKQKGRLCSIKIN